MVQATEPGEASKSNWDVLLGWEDRLGFEGRVAPRVAQLVKNLPVV